MNLKKSYLRPSSVVFNGKTSPGARVPPAAYAFGTPQRFALALVKMRAWTKAAGQRYRILVFEDHDGPTHL